MVEDSENIKSVVRERYGRHAVAGTSCCGPSSGSSCCGPEDRPMTSEQLGYAVAELTAIPDGADLGLGCGNPLAMLELQPGETVLDLGSGAGIDCFVAANRVGTEGTVIGVDMTPEMVERARHNAEQGDYRQVEFRLGEIEHLPVANRTVDAIISNCVINLVPDKGQAFREAFRVLKPGGRLSVSDIVLLAEVPAELMASTESYVACLAGAVHRDTYINLLHEAGFDDVRVEDERGFALGDMLSEDLIGEMREQTGLTMQEMQDAAGAFASIRIRATRAALAD